MFWSLPPCLQRLTLTNRQGEYVRRWLPYGNFRQVLTRIAQLVTDHKFQKVTEILIEWKHRRETENLLYGQPDRRMFITRRRHRFSLQDYVGGYMRMD